MDLRCSFQVQRKLCESTDQSCGGRELAEPTYVLESVEICRKKLMEAVDVCREKLVEASSRSSLSTCLADDGLVVARPESLAQLEQILLLVLPTLLPLRTLLAAEGAIRAMPSFDTLLEGSKRGLLGRGFSKGPPRGVGASPN